MKFNVIYFSVFITLCSLLSKAQIVSGDSTSANVSYHLLNVTRNYTYYSSNPDSTDYLIDIDNDNINDIKFRCFQTISPHSQHRYAQIYNLNSVEFVHTTIDISWLGLWIDSIPLGTIIDNNLNWLDTTSGFVIKANGYEALPPPTTYLNKGFFDLQNGFLGFRKTNQNIYGWINLQRFTSGMGGMSIKSFAYKKLDVSIRENKKDILTFFPNPAKNRLTIQLLNEYSDAKINIISVLGQTVQSFSYNITSSEINIEDLTNGIYYIEAITQKGDRIIKKFIVNH